MSVLEHIPFGVWSTQGLSLLKLEKFCHVDLGCLTTALNPTDLIALGAFRHGAKALIPGDNSTLVLKTACGKFTGSCSHLYVQMGNENIFQKATFWTETQEELANTFETDGLVASSQSVPETSQLHEWLQRVWGKIPWSLAPNVLFIFIL